MLKPVTVAAMFAVPVVALSACSPNEPVATQPGTTPPVWTGSPSPSAPPGVLLPSGLGLKIDNTEAQQVLDRVIEELPQASGGQASVVFTVPDGERLETPERMAAIAETVREVYELQQVVEHPAEPAQLPLHQRQRLDQH